MQIKKQVLEDAILANAELEFYAHGYEHASIRRIIKATGMSIGNFYNYFESKNALFETLVSEEYHKFIHFMTQHEHHMNPFPSAEMLNTMLPEIISRMLPDFTMRFVILIEGSKGTRYSDSRDRLRLLIKEHLIEHARESGVQIQSEICELLADQFISGIIQIVRQNKEDKQTRNKLITDFMMFYFIGVMGIIGSKD